MAKVKYAKQCYWCHRVNIPVAPGRAHMPVAHVTRLTSNGSVPCPVRRENADQGAFGLSRVPTLSETIAHQHLVMCDDAYWDLPSDRS